MLRLINENNATNLISAIGLKTLYIPSINYINNCWAHIVIRKWIASFSNADTLMCAEIIVGYFSKVTYKILLDLTLITIF